MVKPAHVLVVIPHPDDAESRLAGTVARWTREGRDVIYVVCTNGDKGTDDPDLKPEELAGIREQEQLAAAELLGVREVVFLRYPDQALEDTPEFRKDIVRLIRMYQPETVVTVDPSQRYMSHRDHRITGRVTLEAIFPAGRDALAYPDLLEQGIQSHKVKEVLLCGFEGLDYRTNISDTFDIKVAALRCHKTQVGDRPELYEWMRQRAVMLAEGEDYELAEAFHREEVMWESVHYS